MTTSRVTPEWCANMATLEEGHEVGAGEAGLDPTSDCPHAAPFRYCETCKVTPCPIGLGAASRIEAQRGETGTGSISEADESLTAESGDAQTPKSVTKGA